MKVNKKLAIIFGITACFFLAVFFAPAIFKQSNAASEYLYLKTYNLDTFSQTGQSSLDLAGYSVSTADFGADGINEFVLGAPRGGKPLVRLLRSDKSPLNEFLAYDQGFSGGVRVVACDLNSDGRTEIITGPGPGGGPHVRVFDGFGVPFLSQGFFAFDENLRTGINVGCADIQGDGIKEILVTGGDKQKELRIFQLDGTLITALPLSFKADNISLTGIDLGGDGTDEIVVAGGWLDSSLVQIYRGDGSLVNEFMAYSESFTGGVNVESYDIDSDNRDEVLVTPQIIGDSHLRIFDGFGQEKKTSKTYIFSDQFKGGLDLAVGIFSKTGDVEIAFSPQHIPTGDVDCYKCIDIDISEQRFRYYENGYLLGDFVTSTGKPSTATRYGDFTAFAKYEMAYGSADGQNWAMPYFISFYTSGNLENGIHELPFLDGAREGESSLGHAVSHGCVRLAVGPAEEVFNWVEPGNTRVVVHK